MSWRQQFVLPLSMNGYVWKKTVVFTVGLLSMQDALGDVVYIELPELKTYSKGGRSCCDRVGKSCK